MKEILGIMVFFGAMVALMVLYSGETIQEDLKTHPQTLNFIVGNTDLDGRTIISIQTDYLTNTKVFFCSPLPSDVGFGQPNRGVLCNVPAEAQTNPAIIGGDILTVTLILAGGFSLLGIFAGVLGAGQLANIIVAVGIGIAFITGLNLTIPVLFFGMPVVIIALINAIFIILYSYVILRLLK